MREILLAIQTRLKTDANLSYLKDMSIFITEDEGWIPEYAKLPIIGIKDGGISNQFESNRHYIQTSRVKVIGFQSIKRLGETIMGAANGPKGLIEIMTNVRTSLTNYKNLIDSGTNRLDSIFPIDESESERSEGEEEMIQRIIQIYEIKRRRTLPNVS